MLIKAAGTETGDPEAREIFFRFQTPSQALAEGGCGGRRVIGNPTVLDPRRPCAPRSRGRRCARAPSMGPSRRPTTHSIATLAHAVLRPTGAPAVSANKLAGPAGAFRALCQARPALNAEIIGPGPARNPASSCWGKPRV